MLEEPVVPMPSCTQLPSAAKMAPSPRLFSCSLPALPLAALVTPEFWGASLQLSDALGLPCGWGPPRL